MTSADWSLEQAERHLLSLELFGMRFGLERMRRLTTALGLPQQRFASIHVVGTNGKSSTVRMIAAILERHGLCTGAYLSPHLVSFTERVRIGEREVSPASFGSAVGRAARAAELVNRTLAADDRVTQFELLTAAAYSEFALQGVEVAVVEAGLGGRYDATNVIPSSVQVLTNVGLEHTRWLGPTIADIAREKLAVVRDGSVLVVGELDAEATAEVQRATRRHGARLVQAPAATGGVPATGFQRLNFALARSAALAYRGELDERLTATAAAIAVPGRLQIVGRDPLTIYDAAHNPPGVRALVESLPELGADPAGRRLVAVISILDDKDAAGMLRVLLPSCAATVFTANPNPRALSPATLESLAGQVAPAVETEIEPDPRRALARAKELAGPGGSVLATGSVYLIAELLSAPGARRASML